MDEHLPKGATGWLWFILSVAGAVFVINTVRNHSAAADQVLNGV